MRKTVLLTLHFFLWGTRQSMFAGTSVTQFFSVITPFEYHLSCHMQHFLFGQLFRVDVEIFLKELIASERELFFYDRTRISAERLHNVLEKPEKMIML